MVVLTLLVLLVDLADLVEVVEEMLLQVEVPELLVKAILVVHLQVELELVVEEEQVPLVGQELDLLEV